MARVTRSQKVDIAEDITALAAEPPLPDTPSRHEPLSTIVNEAGTNSMTTEASTVPSQLKQLKAAYRNAIGTGKRGRKYKNNKKGQQGVEQEEGAGDGNGLVDGENTPMYNDIPEVELPFPTQDDGLAALLDTLKAPEPMPNAQVNLEQQVQTTQATSRTTRAKLAKQQAGQYYSSDWTGGVNTSSSYGHGQRDYDFITTLFAGRPAGPSLARPFDNLGFQENYVDMTNQYLSLAEEALQKSMNDVNTLLTLGDQALEECSNDTDCQLDETTDEAVHVSIETVVEAPELVINNPEEVNQATEEAGPIYTEEVSNVLVDGSNNGSFISQAISRSPAKVLSRIEDSVEALDQLEEAMDALAQAALAQPIVSPKKAQRGASSERATDGVETVEKRHPASAQASRNVNSTKQQGPRASYATVRVKSTTQKPSPSLRKSTSMSFRPPTIQDKNQAEEAKKVHLAPKTTAKRPLSLLPPKETTKSTKVPTRPNFELPGEAVARKLKEQREARLAIRGSSNDATSAPRTVTRQTSVKSTKQPTKSNFELPGEALSRRKREAHEARVKSQEEEERKRREFKAKPIRKSIAPDFVPRETVASRARQSRVGIENLNSNEIFVSEHAKNHRASLPQPILSNSSASRGPVSKLARKPSTTSGPSMSGLTMPRTVSDKVVQLQRQRAREIYGRDNRLAEEMEREKQEREAAAKRAREQAAERGRQASREWAEKQRLRKLAEGDKGMSAGYGPGGQMGLKG
ncbi:hypothetical protein BJ875DRAFT_461810 [Amylocarpus encephaloides]|uniref:Carboxylesterase family protein n=1 Tax=Amylocarpus encephaloides TaxID=45428 RepID=A0A9P7YIV0_9HELO|nr:hypothetical protein BJ875DRAFT_461810 [Amylocarpus encephaloides]